MLFLDTNAFYYATNLSSNNYVNNKKLREFIIGNEVAISSVSFFEFLVKYRNSIDTIHLGCDFLSENNIKIMYNKYFNRSKDLEKNFSSITKKELKKILESVLEKKIDTESRFASITFSLILFSGLYFYFIQKPENETDIKMYILDICYKLCTRDCLELYKKIYKEGYSTDNSENYIKNKIKEMLETSFGLILPIFDAAKDINTVDEFYKLIADFDFIENAGNKIKK